MAVASVMAAFVIGQLPLPPLPPPPPLPPLPPPPPACLEPPLPPLCLPNPPAPPGDDPPRLPDSVTAKREGKYVMLTWKPATDDRDVWGYRLYRDGNLVARKPETVHHAKLSLPCGRHGFRVEAVDTVQQTASRSAWARRPCRD